MGTDPVQASLVLEEGALAADVGGDDRVHTWSVRGLGSNSSIPGPPEHPGNDLSCYARSSHLTLVGVAHKTRTKKHARECRVWIPHSSV